MFYVAIISALALACAAGVLYFYVLFLESCIRQQRRRIAELERACVELSDELHSAKASLAEDGEHRSETWPELLDENRDCTMS